MVRVSAKKKGDKLINVTEMFYIKDYLKVNQSKLLKKFSNKKLKF